MIAFSILLKSGKPKIYKGYKKEELLKNHEAVIKLLQTAATLKVDHVWSYFNEFIFFLCNFGSKSTELQYITFSKDYSTSFVDKFNNSLFVKNRFWTFETAVASKGVTQSGKFAFEFQLMSDSVTQIGWSTNSTSFNPFGGWGVGDNLDSYAYGGVRSRKWHGRNVDHDTDGTCWRKNDIVTSMLDLDNGTISFLLNGKHMGIAFKDVDKLKSWYPAVSLSLDQCGKFKFGKILDPFVFSPPEYSAIPDGSDFVSSRIDFSDVELDLNFSEKSLLFYYEIQLGILGANEAFCLEVGCISSNGTVTFAAYHFQKQCLYIVQSSLDACHSLLTFDEDLRKTIEEGCDTSEGEIFNVIQSIPKILHEGLRVGVGVDSNLNFVFTLAGKSVKFQSTLMYEGTYIPYFRNIPKFVLNMGEYDFAYPLANHSYSPTKTIF